MTLQVWGSGKKSVLSYQPKFKDTVTIMLYEMELNNLKILQVRYEYWQDKSFGLHAQTNRKEALGSGEVLFFSSF